MDLLTIREAADLTRMSQGFWRQRLFRKEIKYLKVGRRVFIPREVIDDFLARSVIEPKKGPERALDSGIAR
jgi:excisionase family DNA binding protein